MVTSKFSESFWIKAMLIKNVITGHLKMVVQITGTKKIITKSSF